MSTRILAPVVAFCFLWFAATNCPAQNSDEETKSALAVAKAWIAQIDTGHYDESYASGSNALHEKIPGPQWTAILGTLRPQWGDLVSRTEVKHVYKAEGVEGLDGTCFLITYESTFKKLDTIAQEQVVLIKENGHWRGAGYALSPKPSAETMQEQPGSATETTSVITKAPVQH